MSPRCVPVASVVVNEVLFSAEALIAVFVTTIGYTARAALDPFAAFHALHHQENTLRWELASAVEIDCSCDSFTRNIYRLVRADKAVVATAKVASHLGMLKNKKI